MKIRLLSNTLAFAFFAVSALVFSDSLSRLFALWFLLLTSYDGLSVWLFIGGKGAQLGRLRMTYRILTVLMTCFFLIILPPDSKYGALALLGVLIFIRDKG